MTSPTEQRRAFDAAIRHYQAGHTGEALEMFTGITTVNPAMSDAWLGRLACGDHSLDTFKSAHENSRALYRETRRIGLTDGQLYAQATAPLYVTMPVWSPSTIALGYVAALITAGQFRTAAAKLNDPVITEDAGAGQWRQFVTATLYHRAGRWPDVLATVESREFSATHSRADVTAALAAMACTATANLGQFPAALAMAEDVSTDHPLIAADVAVVRGWCLREQGELALADDAFRSATVDGVPLDAARQALDNPHFRLIPTDAETIASRTDEWDPATETSRADREAAKQAAHRKEVLKRARQRLDSLIGLDGPKEQIEVWRTEIELDQLLAEPGDDFAVSNENHMSFEGPPGTAKTTFARCVADILYGLGKIERPEVVEVTEEDLVAGYVSQTAILTKQKCEEALGAVLFIDEAYRLAPEKEGHSFGKDAINTLLKYMEDYRDRLVVIVAGYKKEMSRFWRTNPGLASRFHFTLTFNSYTPDEIVAIARHVAGQERLRIDDAAWSLLHEESARLRAQPDPEAGTRLDRAGNGRFARKVVVACKRERARRLKDYTSSELEQIKATRPHDLVVQPEDMQRALAASSLNDGQHGDGDVGPLRVIHGGN